MLLGEFTYLLEEIGRVIIPAQFAKELRGELCIFVSSDGCICLCPLKTYPRLRSKLGISVHPHRIVIKKHCNYWQIVIPKDLREYARLKREVTVAGCDKYIEIWDKDQWVEEKKRLKTIAVGA